MSNYETGFEIAIIGMSGSFPDAPTVEQFWQNLKNGVSSNHVLTDEELIGAGVQTERFNRPDYVRRQVLLDEIDLFDADFFGYTPREAELMDPQQRLFLMCAWRAVEDAGYSTDKYNGRIGVYAGTSFSSYLVRNLLPNRHLVDAVDQRFLLIGNDKDFLTTRVAYKLNLNGPSLSLQTACSTSLVAVHVASQALISGECDMALAGGVTVRLPQNTGYLYQEGGIDSPDGFCRAFDAQAQGTVGGSGVGIVVLKRLEEAREQGDTIHAIIKGSAINNDGALKVGYTAPQVQGQAAVIRAAQAIADVEAETISYIEAHGTGTRLGDPIEVEALTEAFRVGTDKKEFCGIGSVKTNIGHLDSAAGIAGLIKTVLALKHKMLPPTLHFREPNPEIDFAESPFYVSHTQRAWKCSGAPRRAGVSSFGIGGTNAHVIVEEAPELAASQTSRSFHLLMLSARTTEALQKATTNLAEHLQKYPEQQLADVAYTLQIGRKSFDCRQFFVCHDREDAIKVLQSQEPQRIFRQTRQESQTTPVIFMFPGQGTQYLQMGHDLYRKEPVFRKHFDECVRLLEPHLGLDIRSVVYPNEAIDWSQAEEQLKQTQLAQPVLFALEYALAQMWLAWGIQPKAMIGHSIGEYVAACLAGVFSLPDVLALVVERGRLIQSLPPGKMLAVSLSEEELEPYLQEPLALAAVNCTSRCVVSGPAESIVALTLQLRKADVTCRLLHTSHAFHSVMMAPVLTDFAAKVARISLRPFNIPFISNVSGTWITPEQATDPHYWAQHLRQTVRFGDGLTVLCQESTPIFLEVGAGNTLSTFVHQQSATKTVAVTSLPHPRDEQSDEVLLHHALGHLWLAGVTVDWGAFYAHENRYRIPLPTYPFDLKRFWIEPEPYTQATAPAAKNESVDNWFYQPYWKPAAPLPPQTMSGTCLIFDDQLGVGSEIARLLAKLPLNIIMVTSGSAFGEVSPNHYTLNPAQKSDYHALWSALSQPIDHIIHLWNVTDETSTFEHYQIRGFYSLLFLAQAWGEQPHNSELRISVVTNELQKVHASDHLCPEKATLIGPCRVIPQEYAHVSCRNVDIVLPEPDTWQMTQLVQRLVTEIGDPDVEPMVAYRQGRRWLPDYEATPLKPTAAWSPRWRDGGIYLLTGGLGGVGLLLAEHLAHHVEDVKLVLTGRTPFPAREEWPTWQADISSRTQNGTSTALLTHLQARAASLVLASRGLDAFTGLAQMACRLCSSYILEYLDTVGLDTRSGSSYGEAALLPQLNILPKFERFFTRLLAALEEDEIVVRQNGHVTFQAHDLPPTTQLRAEVEANYPQFEAIFHLLARCVKHYPQALSGEVEAITVLYPDGRADLIEQVNQQMIDHSNQKELAVLIGEVIQYLVQQKQGQKINILEVGAGNGRLTKMLMPMLDTHQVTYHFTDISKRFTVAAERELPADFMMFDVLDISQNPARQGYESQQYDIIVALNVIHATPHIQASLTNLKQLLKPEGTLAFIETVKSERWVDMIWGLTDGWWHFADDRQTSPLLDVPQWQKALLQQGYQAVAVFPEDPDQQSSTDVSLLLAHQPIKADARRLNDQIEKLRALERLGARVLVLSGDVSSHDDMQRILVETEAQFGQVNGVIHLAVKGEGGVMQFKDKVNVVQEFAPKIQGTQVISTLLKERNLDFLILFSSINSILGGFGLADYCGASAFLDAFAQAHYADNQTLVTTINWDRWMHVGTAVAAEKRHKMLTGQEVVDGMTAPDALKAFNLILAHEITPQVIVSTRDFVQRRQESQDLKKQYDRQTARPQLHHARPALGSKYEPPNSATEKLIANIWQDVFGIEAVGIHDNFTELGGDSLLATQLISRMREHLGSDLSLRIFFENPTIGTLAQTIDDMPEETDGIDALEIDGSEDDIEALLREIENLSPEEVRTHLTNTGEVFNE